MRAKVSKVQALRWTRTKSRAILRERRSRRKHLATARAEHSCAPRPEKLTQVGIDGDHVERVEAENYQRVILEHDARGSTFRPLHPHMIALTPSVEDNFTHSRRTNLKAGTKSESLVTTTMLRTRSRNASRAMSMPLCEASGL